LGRNIGLLIFYLFIDSLCFFIGLLKFGRFTVQHTKDIICLNVSAILSASTKVNMGHFDKFYCRHLYLFRFIPFTANTNYASCAVSRSNILCVLDN